MPFSVWHGLHRYILVHLRFLAFRLALVISELWSTKSPDLCVWYGTDGISIVSVGSCHFGADTVSSTSRLNGGSDVTLWSGTARCRHGDPKFCAFWQLFVSTWSCTLQFAPFTVRDDSLGFDFPSLRPFALGFFNITAGAWVIGNIVVHLWYGLSECVDACARSCHN